MIVAALEVWTTFTQWLSEHRGLMTVLGVASVVFFIASLLAIPVIVKRLPRDFLAKRHDPVPFRFPSTAARWVILVAKNAVGVILLLSGIAMIFLPGQGLLTIALGIAMINFPGKRAVERRLLLHPKVVGTLNWIRRRAGVAEFDEWHIPRNPRSTGSPDEALPSSTSTTPE